MEKGFHLEIISPVKSVFDGEVKSVTVPGVMGSFQVLKNHAPMISSFGIGRIVIETENGTEMFSTSGGTFEVRNNHAIALAESVESKEEIDLSRANNSLHHAEEILKKAEATADEKEEAKVALQRAVNRIRIAEKK